MCSECITTSTHCTLCPGGDFLNSVDWSCTNNCPYGFYGGTTTNSLGATVAGCAACASPCSDCNGGTTSDCTDCTGSNNFLIII
jgi:hypothetical protein